VNLVDFDSPAVCLASSLGGLGPGYECAGFDRNGGVHLKDDGAL
jgi:hypothetical protein